MSTTRLAILGVGLIGGSLGLCLKATMGDSIYITGYSRSQASRDKAVLLSAVDAVSGSLEEVVKGADIVYLSPPVLQIVPLVKKILPFLKPGTILTDAGSTKEYIWEHLREILPKDIFYIAGHPMAGREKSGVEAATKDLFQGKAYVLIEGTGAPKEAVDRLMQLLRHTGANFTTLDLATHDRCASVISHVPHVTAASLVTLLGRTGDDMESCIKLVGGGFTDTTRIASSNADMWADICMTNPKAITTHLKELQGILGEVIDAINRDDREAIYAFFTASKELRDRILSNASKRFDPN